MYSSSFAEVGTTTLDCADSMTRINQLLAAMRRLDAQQRWMDKHGATLDGYVTMYGSKDGEEIYAADRAQLDQLKRSYWVASGGN